MNLIALAGALGGGLVGSLIWGGVTYATNYEIGWIAWGIGALVGFAGALLGIATAYKVGSRPREGEDVSTV